MASADLPIEREQDCGPDQPLIPSLHELLQGDPDQFVAKYTDIAAVNLACARGLPNAAESEFPEYLKLIDTIADAVRQETQRCWRVFKLKPAQFHNSENVFRIYTMEHVFRARFNIKYDPIVHKNVERGTWTTIDSTEVFINGILSAKRTGTCSSLPTFAIAVGRRLGYPLKLVLVPNHTLYRWDDGDEVFNLQHTEGGGEVQPDEYFYKWPRTWDETDYAINERTKIWLHSMTPMQEVSKFLCNRALLLGEIGRYDEAFQVIDAAERFNPINPACGEIRFTILHKMQNQPTMHPANPTVLNTATIAMQSCLAAGHKELAGAIDAIACHKATIENSRPQAGPNRGPTKSQIQIPVPRRSPNHDRID